MGMPSPGWDSVVREHNAAARRRRRRRRRRTQRLMLWLLTLVTAVVLVAIGMFVRDIARTPTVAALSSSAHAVGRSPRSEEHTSELQSLRHLVCRLLLE